MNMSNCPKTIVISAVNLVEAGTLAILRDCLRYLSKVAADGEYKVVAIVYKRVLTDFPNIEYIETQWPKRRWINRLWYEYVSMKRISKNLSPVYLWLSLHDTTPSVVAKHRVVYCHNSFPFYRWKIHDVLFAPKIVSFALFSKYIYKRNIYQNNYLVVQQEWFRKSLSKMFGISLRKIIVAPPQSYNQIVLKPALNVLKVSSFLFAGSPNSHKNFEVICRAVAILEIDYGIRDFKVSITLKGTENKYAKWLYKHWGNLSCMDFMGFVDTQTLKAHYAACDCLIFPSKVETWGLPISEFMVYDKPMLLADLPYSHETAGGSQRTAFFDPENAEQLAALMQQLVAGNHTILAPVPKISIHEPMAHDWQKLFETLLRDGTINTL